MLTQLSERQIRFTVTVFAANVRLLTQSLDFNKTLAFMSLILSGKCGK